MEEAEEDFEQPIRKRNVTEVFRRRPCCSRIEELAKPKKHVILALWESYKYMFDPERKEAVRLLLQELYAMTPEETEKYFKQITNVLDRIVAKRIMKQKLLWRCRKKNEEKEKKRACRKFRSIIRRMLEYAVRHPTPTLASPRLRQISNLILEQLCDLCNVEVPDRGNADGESLNLIRIADFIATGFENIYFEVQVSKNKEFELIEEEIKRKEKHAKKKPRH